MDLDQLDINEAVEMAANAVVSTNQQDDCQQFENNHDSNGGYQKVPPNEHDDENTSDEDSIGGEENGGDLENNCEGINEAEGSGISRNHNFENQNMSVVQALASGVEVAASEGGKVRLFLECPHMKFSTPFIIVQT